MKIKKNCLLILSSILNDIIREYIISINITYTNHGEPTLSIKFTGFPKYIA